MQYLTLVEFLAEITYRKKNCLSVFGYYGILKPSQSSTNHDIYMCICVCISMIMLYSLFLIRKMRIITTYVGPY